ncbi:MAG TPA: crossover junction endodeoxyribonuclease RuvC [Blastocatellia bacterium]|nr:crossover junction endodeoxyribonuclease RuvC [Blastocatellia bacterium]
MSVDFASRSPSDRAGSADRRLRVLGVDPGSDTTGYGVIDSLGGGYELVEYAGIRAPARFAFAERLYIITQKLEEVIERLRPHACAVEETFYAVNVKSALKLGHVRGVILVAAARAGVPVFEYSPLEIKSALVGYGRAEKHQVQEMVRLLLGLKDPPEPLDASDALAAAICHINTASTRQKMKGSRP